MGAAADFAQGTFSILSGLNEKERLKEQAYAAEYEAQIHRLRGKQEGAARREELNSTLSAISVLRSQRGLSSDSPTAMAIRRDQRRQSRDAENAAVLGHKLDETASRNRASSLRRAAPWAAAGGFARSLSSFADGANKFSSMFGGG